MKKFLSVFVFMLLISSLALTGCSSGGKDSSSGSKSDNGNSAAANYPNKPIKIIVPSSAGGGTDTTTRALVKATKPFLTDNIAVVNKPGGSGAIGMSYVANSKPDGYTLCMTFVEMTFLHSEGLANVTYKDFEPIALINSDPGAITVKANSKWKTAKDLIQYAKAHPGEVKVGTAGTGSIWDLVAAYIEKKTGVKFKHVPYKGAAPAVKALLSGEVDMVTVSPAEVLSQVQSGKLRMLAVASDKRSDVLPKVPTMKEAGIGDIQAGTWRGLVAPKGTPQAIIDKLDKAFVKGAKTDEFQKFMHNAGLGIKIKHSDEFGQFIKQNVDRWSQTIKDLGLAK
ncbi:MAG TPA: tripartite tricarboxylate transporter substrate binding protein [Bacillales bacterium]|nr:tripartite tricarboxylate transporter substrate binding protein [Bacillales bacterium]